jgi:hypothetical protein
MALGPGAAVGPATTLRHDSSGMTRGASEMLQRDTLFPLFLQELKIAFRSVERCLRI